jgi:hypothetical protein
LRSRAFGEEWPNDLDALRASLDWRLMTDLSSVGLAAVHDRNGFSNASKQRHAVERPLKFPRHLGTAEARKIRCQTAAVATKGAGDLFPHLTAVGIAVKHQHRRDSVTAMSAPPPRTLRLVF